MFVEVLELDEEYLGFDLLDQFIVFIYVFQMVISQNPLLSTFEQVAKSGTLVAAGAQLGLTQTALTKRILHLEESLGVTLFLRSRRGMLLTEEGRALLQLCKAGLELEGQFMSQIKGDSRQDISLTLVGPTSAISKRIVENCLPLYEKYPFLQLNLQVDDHMNLVERVRMGSADIAVVSPREVPKELESKLLKSDRYLLVASSKWKGRRLNDILATERIIDFYESDTTTKKYLEQFDLQKFVGKARLFVNENEALIRYFAAGVGFGTLTDAIARPHIANGSLITLNHGHFLEDPLALVWYKRTQRADYFSDLIRCIK